MIGVFVVEEEAVISLVASLVIGAAKIITNKNL